MDTLWSFAWNLVCFTHWSFVVDTHWSFAWNLVRMRVLLWKWTLIFCEECDMLYTLELGGECTLIICAKSYIRFTHSSLAVLNADHCYAVWTFWICFTQSSLLVNVDTLCRLHKFEFIVNWCKLIFCVKIDILYTSEFGGECSVHWFISRVKFGTLYTLVLWWMHTDFLQEIWCSGIIFFAKGEPASATTNSWPLEDRL